MYKCNNNNLKNLFYYKLEEAEQIMQNYSSWIGKEAHVGKGTKGVLQSITIKPKRVTGLGTKTEKVYKVEFEFESNRRFSAFEFLFHNSLMSTFNHPYILNKKKDRAA